MEFTDLTQQIISALAPLVVALLGALIAYATKYFRDKAVGIKVTFLRDALDRALQEAQAVATESVAYANQKFVEDLKEKAADGKLTADEAREAMSIAVQYFVTHISQESARILKAALGDIGTWVESLIETKVYNNNFFRPKVAKQPTVVGGDQLE